MKILKWILGILIALFLLFILIGFISPTYDESIVTEIDAPVEKTFAIANDEKYMSQWLENYKSMELIKGDGKSKGSQWKVVFDQNGKDFEMIETVTDYIENEKFAFDINDDHGKYNISLNFEEKNGKTILTERMVGAAKGMMDKSFVALMKSSIKKQKSGWYQNLKKLVESTDWTPPSPILPAESEILKDTIK